MGEAATSIILPSDLFSHAIYHGPRHGPQHEPHHTTLTRRPTEDLMQPFWDPGTQADQVMAETRIRIAREAYEDAVSALRKSLSKDEVDSVLSPKTSTARDLSRVAIDIQKFQSGVLDKRKLARFVEALNHYQGVFDVLSQADFSFLPVLWGPMKFILIMSKNHCTFLSKVTDFMIEIGLNLQRIQLYGRLFPTTRMLELISELYVAIAKFLGDIIAHCRKKAIMRYMSSFQPFDMKFGMIVDQIRRLQQCIEDDARAGAMVHQIVHSRSLEGYRSEAGVYRSYDAETFKGLRGGTNSNFFLEIQRRLFLNFEVNEKYHAELAATYKVTASKAWNHWFNRENQYLCGENSGKTTLVQAECDAPDAQYAQQWITFQKAKAPTIPAAYLVWARGMTAQSAIASLLFQLLQQKPELFQSAELTMRNFSEANTSIAALWSLFLQLTRRLGGCMVYLSIGSAGPEEFALVRKFVRMASRGDGPAINITIIHPYHDMFLRSRKVVDLDAKEDILPEPWLTTTDALQHVLLLEMNLHAVSSTLVRTVLWETLWREVRYTVMGVAVNQVVDRLKATAAQLALDLVDRKKLSDPHCAFWLAGVERWLAGAMNVLREQIQRHLELVDIHLPPEIKARLSAILKLVVFDYDGEDVGANKLEDKDRCSIWERLQGAIGPGAQSMFCGRLADLIGEMLDEYRQAPPETEPDAWKVVGELGCKHFGKSGNWKESFLNDQALIIDGIVSAIEIGFKGIVDALFGVDKEEL